MAQRWRHLEVKAAKKNPRKWRVALKEDVFTTFLAEEDAGAATAVFAVGCLFSPLLFGNFFDPADVFPLWDFDPESLLAAPPDSAAVSWSQSPPEYLLVAALPDAARDDVAVAVEEGRVIEISGRWRRRRMGSSDWRAGKWWEEGFVRRLELPEDARGDAAAARVEGGGAAKSLVIRVPRISAHESSCKER